MPSPQNRALRLPLIRLLALLGRRMPSNATTRVKPADIGAMSAHILRDIGLGS